MTVQTEHSRNGWLDTPVDRPARGAGLAAYRGAIERLREALQILEQRHRELVAVEAALSGRPDPPHPAPPQHLRFLPESSPRSIRSNLGSSANDRASLSVVSQNLSKSAGVLALER